MDDPAPESTSATDSVLDRVAISVEFISALFVAQDTIHFRPIESWVEAGKNCSRVDYQHSRHFPLVPESLPSAVYLALRVADHRQENLYFGVCPRFGGGGQFNSAWQIRTVRVLWSDVDNVTYEQVLERLDRAGLPQPSIVVNSGHGVHLYWLLNQPYQIDDVGDPLPVLTEWPESCQGKRRPRKYILESGDRIYLDNHRYLSRLSAKAVQIQEVLAGIAKAIGGDHTTDLSRLLRVPGSFNRKDQRNGREPVPTALIECDPTRTYPLSCFETYRFASPESARAQHIAAMAIPVPRKITAKKADQLAELISVCAIAEAGSRSEADFAVCCYAIRTGIAKEEAWARVQKIGKFAEQGERYFELTWSNAEYDVRVAKLEKLQKQAIRSAAATVEINGVSVNSGDPPAGDGDASSGNHRVTISVAPATILVADTLGQITDALLSARVCFIRSEQLVVVRQGRISTVLSSGELAGLLNEYAEIYFMDDDGGEFKPLPPAYANTWLNKHAELSRFSEITLFTRNPVYTEDWRLTGPGFDRSSGIYYAGPSVEPREGTEHLDSLLRDFCFKSKGDRTNYIGMLLTAILVPRFIGSKPAALFSGNQPELGKSILAQIISIVRDGQSAETASYNPNDEEFEKRLGSIVRRGATTIIIDNAKAQGRHPRIDSACLERSITDPVLSFRLLGQSASIRAENSHIFCITANTPDVSRDLVTRSVVINLYHEGDPGRREFSIADPEGYAQQYRSELLGELIGMVERWKASGMPIAKAHSRFNKRGWGKIIGGILEICGAPDFLCNAQEAAGQLDETRREFAELVNLLVRNPQGIWSPTELVKFCQRHALLVVDLGSSSARSQSTKMGTLAGRFLNECFPLADGGVATFHRAGDRKGNVYCVHVTEDAEP